MYHEISDKNQEFKTSDLIAMMALLVAVASSVTLILVNQAQRSLEGRALRDVENITAELLTQLETDSQVNRDSTVSPTSRQVTSRPAATEGTIGIDPWGGAYRYKLWSSDDTAAPLLIVWSLGPNQLDETLGENKLSSLPSFGGDDLGTIRWASGLAKHISDLAP